MGFIEFMLQINPKKFKQIQNKAIPSPLRPKFRKNTETSIYFLSKRKIDGEKKKSLINKIKLLVILSFLSVIGYFLSN